MKPITDRHHVSRAKLAYIIDATAAPICIIAPISSWAAAVGSYLKNTGAFDSEFKAFITAIPYNFYAILSLLMVFLLCVFSLDFGPMAKQEVLAERGFLGGLDFHVDTGVAVFKPYKVGVDSRVGKPLFNCLPRKACRKAKSL